MRSNVLALVGIVLVVATVVVVGGCGAGSSATNGLPGGFTLIVNPEVMNALPGERCVLLATVSEAGRPPHPNPVEIVTTCPGAEVEVENPLILPGEVAEITVIPGARAASQLDPGGPEPDYILTAVITATRSGTSRGASVQLNVITGFEDQLAPAAAEMRSRFTSWLAENSPELGITSQTQWTGTMPSPLLVVEHYLYFNDEWEMHLEWHVMIPPYDWVRMELRRRFDETAYSLAYEISSRSADPQLEPMPIEPMNLLWR